MSEPSDMRERARTVLRSAGYVADDFLVTSVAKALAAARIAGIEEAAEAAWQSVAFTGYQDKVHAAVLALKEKP